MPRRIIIITATVTVTLTLPLPLLPLALSLPARSSPAACRRWYHNITFTLYVIVSYHIYIYIWYIYIYIYIYIHPSPLAPRVVEDIAFVYLNVEIQIRNMLQAHLSNRLGEKRRRKIPPCRIEELFLRADADGSGGITIEAPWRKKSTHTWYIYIYAYVFIYIYIYKQTIMIISNSRHNRQHS